jgi:hypothetical protein
LSKTNHGMAYRGQTCFLDVLPAGFVPADQRERLALGRRQTDKTSSMAQIHFAFRVAGMHRHAFSQGASAFVQHLAQGLVRHRVK